MCMRCERNGGCQVDDAFGEGFKDGAVLVTEKEVSECVSLPPEALNWPDSFCDAAEELGASLDITVCVHNPGHPPTSSALFGRGGSQCLVTGAFFEEW